MSDQTNSHEYSRKDFLSKTEPRWCSGCGDYFIMQALTATWAKLGIPKENFLVISGIGCSSRLPYYANTFGFHTIHGRAPTVAMGAAIANPDLSIWIITGDGDGLSIGGNHFMHLMRRNPNVNIVLFNNEIYGLTKGQASPTSKQGIKTKSTPFGSLEPPVNPLSLALSSGASFAARVIDTNPSHMKEVFQKAHEHKGVSFIEAYTNCVIFNDGAFEPFEKRSKRAETTVELKDGQAMIYGTNKDKALSLEGLSLTTINANADDLNAKALVHKEEAENNHLAYLLAQAAYPQLPLPIGVLYRRQDASYQDKLQALREESIKLKGAPDLSKLLSEGETWTVS